jgi:ribosomal protein S18 acetylase RimI-like enzyme|tara:strand:- start:554 stop:1063 length:510 start_codon:yes stop_codon:yes gene_type:complete
MIKIELAEITDIDRIMEITKACAIDLITKNIFQWNEKYPSKEVFKKDIEKNTLYVCKNKLQITGCISICTDKDEEYENVKWITEDFKNLYLHRLAVHPEYQKKGIGKFIMDFAEEYAKLNGFKSIRLDTFSQNKRNNRFYKSRQYVQLGDIFFPMQSKFPFHCYEKIIN